MVKGVSHVGFLCLLFTVVQCQRNRNQPPYFTNTWNWKVKETDPIGSSPVSGLLFGSSDTIVLKAYDNEGQRLKFKVKGDMGNKYFTVDEYTGVVKVRKQFDYEVDSRYTAKFTVSDGVNTVEAEARITVVDANDNAPIFEKFPYYFEIPESAEMGRDIGYIHASDPDTGRGGEVSYFIQNGYDGPFSLDRSTGLLQLREPLDYETTQSYSFLVIAKDHDTDNPLSSVVQVIIRVQDMQDTDPVFKKLPYDVTIFENTPRGTEVTCIKAEDGDMGSPNRVVYSMVSGNEEGDFLLDSASGKLRVASVIDRDVVGFDGVYRLTVRATELPTKGSRGGAFSETSLTVTVTDVDDQIPTWNWQMFSTTLPENAALGTRLAIDMRVKDLDQGINSEMTLSVDKDHARYFSPTPSILQGGSDVSIVLIKSLDYELKKSLKFKVFANESVDPKKSAVCEVIIDVTNVNDEHPIFDQAVYSVEVPENVTLDSTVMTVHARDGDEGLFGKVSYSMDDKARKFNIDTKTGEVYVVGDLDREGVFQYSIPVTARDGGSPPLESTAIVIIQLGDVNDNIPVFDARSYFVTINENEMPRDSLIIVRAIDADSDLQNNNVTYSIESENIADKFIVKKSKNGEGLIYLIEPLDFEELLDGRLEVTLGASDGRSSMKSTASLVITVMDVNDNFPKFTKDSDFNITIREDIGSGVTIGRITAIDRDEGANARITYTVDDQSFGDVFRIDSQNGEISVKPGACPDHELIPSYDVLVIAVDDGSPLLSVQHRLIINVLDVNDNSPRFNETRYEVTLTEGIRGFITQVAATDADSGTHGSIVYRIIRGNEDRTFSIDQNTGVIRSMKPLDFESSNGVYKLTVSAVDSPEQSEVTQMITDVDVIINVIDTNDNAPQFVGDVSSARYTVVEGVEGTTIARFHATDKDSGKNGEIWFQLLHGNELGYFEISHSGGILRIRPGFALDREETPFHQLTVCVMDKGDVPLNSTANITIEVADTNDNSPKFVNFPLTINVPENATVGSALATISAQDEDLGAFGRVFYKISSGNDHGIFTLETKTGTLRLAKEMNREEQEKFILQISAFDNPGSKQNSRMESKQLTVLVDDVNDQTPRFLGATPYRATVEENSPVGQIIILQGDAIKAEDKDSGINAEIAYSLIKDKLSMFQIDSKTGVISTKAEIDREVLPNDVIHLEIRASDVDGFHSDVVVLITIEDVNDNKPRFESESISLRVLENLEPGSEIYKLSATDDDLGVNGDVSYRLQKSQVDKFIIEPSTGMLRLAPGQSLDKEETDHYDLVAVAYDHGMVTSLSKTIPIRITIDDVNDSRPKFNEKVLVKEVKENAVVGSVIAEIIAIDDDESANIRYFMTSFSAYNDDGREMIGRSLKQNQRKNKRSSNYYMIKSWFHLNSTTGEVTVSSLNENNERAIDREICSMVEFEIEARDLASNVKEADRSSEPIIVQIHILDENDNAPRFIVTSTNGQERKADDEIVIEVTEESAIGSILTTLSAYDPDIGSNGKVVYDVIDGRKVKMREKDSGVLIVNSRIDRENMEIENDIAWMNVSILARDLGFPTSKSTKLRLKIKIKDINDNSPKFDEKFYQLSIFENVTVGSEVGLVTATDADSGPNGDITYRLKGGKGKFQIHPKTGSVRLTSSIDREENSELSFIVTALDNERGAEADRRETTTQVVVIIMDVNDNAPEFYEPESSFTSYTVQESAGTRTFVTAVAARDPDVGESSKITYSLKRSRLATYFTINPTSGHISVRRKLSVRSKSFKDKYLYVYATDGGGLQSNITLEVNIADVNDHAPVFVGKGWNETEVTEESPGGIFVTQLQARDDDEGLNAMIRFSFCDVTIPKDIRPFFIDELTGRIITSQKLDREAKSEYTLRVCASDLGQPRLQTLTTVKVIVRDINDNRPSFEQKGDEGAEQFLKVSEDFPVREVIGRVNRASDVDHGRNAEIFYHLVAMSGSDAKRHLNTFAVQPRTGDIILRSKLDREQKNRFVLIIGATNNGNVTLSQPVTSQYKFPAGIMSWDEHFIERKAEKKTVGMLRVGSLRYRDVMPLPEQPIDRNTATFDPERDSSLIRLVIDIEDVNDEWPRFQHDKYSTAVDINTNIGTEIAKVKAIDLDEGSNGMVSYRITQTLMKSYDKTSDRLFTDLIEINRDGSITTSQQLKSFSDGYFVINVEARDNAKHYAIATVYVYTLHTNERVRLVLDTPLNIVKDKEESLTNLLSNNTGWLVIVEKLMYDVSPNGDRNMEQTDVTIRAFDTVTMTEVVREKLSKRLEDKRDVINRLFGDYNIKSSSQAWEDDNSSQDEGAMQAVIISLISLLLIILVLFAIFYCRMRRHYIHRLKEMESMEYNDTTVSSRGRKMPFWNQKAFQHLRKKSSHDDVIHEEFSETDDAISFSSRYPVPAARKINTTASESSTDATPVVKLRSRSENDRLDRGMPRTSTDVWVPRKADKRASHSGVYPRPRDHTRQKRSVGKRNRRSANKPIYCPSSEGGDSAIDVSESRRTAERPKSLLRDNRGLVSISQQQHEEKFPSEMNLHSGGNSGPIGRRQEMETQVSRDSSIIKSPRDHHSAEVSSSMESVTVIPDM